MARSRHTADNAEVGARCVVRGRVMLGHYSFLAFAASRQAGLSFSCARSLSLASAPSCTCWSLGLSCGQNTSAPSLRLVACSKQFASESLSKAGKLVHRMRSVVLCCAVLRSNIDIEASSTWDAALAANGSENVSKPRGEDKAKKPPLRHS